MILYQGKLLENKRQAALIDSLGNDLCRTLQDEPPLLAEQVIGACDALAQKALTGYFDAVILPLLETFGIGMERFAPWRNSFCGKDWNLSAIWNWGNSRRAWVRLLCGSGTLWACCFILRREMWTACPHTALWRDSWPEISIF